MINNEASMVYSTAYNASLQSTSNFTISSSQSQGFSWNQDLFASQYQQMCKVIYDGHEDTMDGLIEYIKENYKKFSTSNTRQHAFSSSRMSEISHSHHFGNDDDDDDDVNYDDDDEALTDCEGEAEDEGSYSRQRGLRFLSRSNSGFSLHPRISEEFNRPRRISERSISFVSDSKNGNYNRSDTAVIDVESDTLENNHLKWLIST